MRAVRFHGREDIRVDEIEEPICGPGQVKLKGYVSNQIKPAFVGICGSDLHEYLAGPIAVPVNPHRITGDKLPTTLGHEFSGTIEEVGEGVTGLNVGDKVAVNPSLSDGTCGNCEIGRSNSCYNLGFIGYSSRSGGLSDHVSVDKKHVFRLPDSIPLDIGALVEPISVAWHAVSRTPIRKDDAVLVVGAGPIGLAIVQVLKAHGIEEIIVVEISEKRGEFALAFGAAKVLNPAKVDALAEVRALTARGNARGTAVAFETSGVQAGLDLAMSALKVRGTTVLVSLWEKPPTLNAIHFLVGEKHIVGTIGYEDCDFEAVIEALATGKIIPRSMITSKIPMNEVVEKGLKALIHDKEKHVKILIDVSA
ncbi:hypothetical protein N7456_003389 [Penicillium angulare]|uniref:Enoyl reductase (ER) domain-containing protein n=1 Tax=Penicillium angulare TaxID=116970 RepID=A0A9W9FUQ8_9EURO|nr:hypothetical protein N7456_003389 [Penicillium angulare]